MPNHGDYHYAFIIGAAKCGTTALAEMLASHPGICVSTPKETNFFTNEGQKKTMEWFSDSFSHKPEVDVRIDASVSYSAGWGGGCTNIAERLKDFAPNSKIIYMVRDPIERTWSAYWHAVRSGYEDKSFKDSISNLKIDHIMASLYYARIKDYQNYYPKDSILVIHQNQLKTRPQEVINKICGFLGLAPYKILISKTSATANSSQMYSPTGKIIHMLFPQQQIKKFSIWVRNTLPQPLLKIVRKIYSKPLPEMTKQDAIYLKNIFKDDAEKLLKNFDINVKSSSWWD